MSRQNVDLVHRVTNYWIDRDSSDVAEVFDPEVVVDLSRNVFNPGVYSGYAGLERFAAAVDEMWENFHAELGEVIEVGDAVVTAARITGVGRGSGVEAAMDIFQVWTFRGGRVLTLTGGYRARSEAIEAAAGTAAAL